MARTVGAYNGDGSPDAELVVHPQRRALPARIDQIQHTVSALAGVGLLLLGVVVVTVHHAALDALPSFVK